MFTILETYFDSLARQGPGRGYYPNQTKSVLSLSLYLSLTGLRDPIACVCFYVLGLRTSKACPNYEAVWDIIDVLL